MVEPSLKPYAPWALSIGPLVDFVGAVPTPSQEELRVFLKLSKKMEGHYYL